MKGQTLIIQFLLFFLIGLGLFIGVGNLFSFQFNLYREDIGDKIREHFSSYFTSIILHQNSCKACDKIDYKVVLRNRTAGYLIRIMLDKHGLLVLTSPGEEYYLASIHNLNETFILSGSAHSMQPIKIMFSKKENKIEIWQ